MVNNISPLRQLLKDKQIHVEVSYLFACDLHTNPPTCMITCESWTLGIFARCSLYKSISHISSETTPSNPTAKRQMFINVQNPYFKQYVLECNSLRQLVWDSPETNKKSRRIRILFIHPPSGSISRDSTQHNSSWFVYSRIIAELVVELPFLGFDSGYSIILCVSTQLIKSCLFTVFLNIVSKHMKVNIWLAVSPHNIGKYHQPSPTQLVSPSVSCLSMLYLGGLSRKSPIQLESSQSCILGSPVESDSMLLM